MSTLSQIFQYNGHQVRIAGTAENPWFMAKDVFEALDMSWAGNQSLDRIKEEWKMTQPTVDPSGRTQESWYISEPALYKVVFRSNKPEAERFTDWIAQEVLPSIRKSGSYSVQPMSQLQILQGAINQLVSMEEQLNQLSEGQSQLNNRLSVIEGGRQEAIAEMEALPAPSSPPAPMGLDDEVRKLINSYAEWSGMTGKRDRSQLWNFLYSNFYYRYRVSVEAHKLNKNESKIQCVKRIGKIQDLYDLAYYLFAKDEDGNRHQYDMNSRAV